MKTLTFLIATKNRREELKITLARSQFLLDNEQIDVIICDDGSTDGTSSFIQETYPQIQLLRNEISKGILSSRNLLFSSVKTRYAITIDDDINFVGNFSISDITDYFKDNPKCAVMAFRIFWGKKLPSNTNCSELPMIVKSFGAGGHALDMKALEKIPKLPEWFKFYGEEDYMSIEFFKVGKRVHYTPQILVHHRVDLKERRREADYYHRMRLSIRSGWYLYVMFYPKKKMWYKLAYSIYSKLKYRVLKGDIKVLLVLILAGKDFILNYPRMISYTRRLNSEEYDAYSELPAAKIYWNPKVHD